MRPTHLLAMHQHVSGWCLPPLTLGLTTRQEIRGRRPSEYKRCYNSCTEVGVGMREHVGKPVFPRISP